MPLQAAPDFIEVQDYYFPGIGFPGKAVVHVWLLPVRPAVYEGLSAKETDRAMRFQQSADADRFCTARLGLRRLAGAYLGLPPSEVQIAGRPHQKPFLAHEMAAPLHFNSSHSGNLVLIAFGGLPVGIDIEAVEPHFNPRDLIPEHFNEEEVAAISGAPGGLPAFYQLWTRKEALAKGKGTGLGETLREMPVLPDLPGAGTSREPWQLLSFLTQPGYAAALACNVSVHDTVFCKVI